MNDDVVQLLPSVRARLTRVGADVKRSGVKVGLLTTEEFFRFWDFIGKNAPRDVGFRLATETRIHEYDVSFLAALHSPDVRAALEKLALYKRLCAPKSLSVERVGRDVVVHTEWFHAQRPAPTRLVDSNLASMLVLLQRGTGTALAPKRVELTRAPTEETQLRRFFGSPIRFRAKRDALVFDERVLELPFVTRNDELLQVLAPGLEAKLKPLERRSFVDKVRAALTRRMHGEKPSVAKLAHELAMSPRTFQRRLEENGVSYQAVLDDVRRATALRLLSKREVAEVEVSFLLGFEEPNSFHRAFRSWEGVTPHQWRRNHGVIG